MTVRAYVLRHGATAESPQPELWQPLGLIPKGREEATAAAVFLRSLDPEHWVKPDTIITSDLVRSTETACIAGETLGIPMICTEPELRAYNPQVEDDETYEQRTASVFGRLLVPSGTTPLIVAHRSTTAALDRLYGPHRDQSEGWRPDYVHDTLLHEGGILAITNPDLRLAPLFRYVEASWRGRERLGVDT